MSGSRKTDVLIVDDERATCEYLGDVLTRENYNVTLATTGADAIRLINEKHFPIILSDLHLGDPDGMDLLTVIKKSSKPSLLIFITGYGSVDTAVKAIQQGAFDYLSKPLNLMEVEPELKLLMSRAENQLRTNSNEIPHEVPKLKNPAISIIGNSPQMVSVYRVIAKAAMTESNLLITGESGTGKELVARAVHDNSSRATKPFIAVNCCALSEGVLESELFGHIRGSFTGATASTLGLFEQADGGTLFLDEIGDISPALQVKLLRVLQEGEIKPVGATENRKVNVRVIAATHRNLEEAVTSGHFREDLYYRLKVILIEVPPLRERRADLEGLIEYFLQKSANKTERKVTGISPEAMALLLNYTWPGNVRELENAVERAVAMTNTQMLFPEDFPAEISKQSGEIPQVASASSDTGELKSLEEVEKAHIRKTLELVRFNKSRAATILGIDRVTLYRKAYRYGIQLAAVE